MYVSQNCLHTSVSILYNFLLCVFRYQLSWVRGIRMVNCLSISRWYNATRASAQHWWRTDVTSMLPMRTAARCCILPSSEATALLHRSWSRMAPTPTRPSTQPMKRHYTSSLLTLHHVLCLICHREGRHLGRVRACLKWLGFYWSMGLMLMLRIALAILHCTELYSPGMRKCSTFSWAMTGLEPSL